MTRAALRGGDLLGVAAGAAVGAVLRWSIGEAWPVGSGFPWSTLAINVIGALMLGALPLLVVARRDHRIALLIGPGLLGGFTTVSTWAGETRGLAVDQPALALAYVVATLGAGLLAAHVGLRIARQPEPEDAET